ncbi:Serine/threonine kinase mps1 [Mitosporidium daphniae]
MDDGKSTKRSRGLLGRGASAKIYSAFCVEDSKLVAIKIFSRSSTSSNSGFNFCEHEQRILENLVGKPHCIQLIDASIAREIIILERGEATLSALLTSEKIGDLRFIAYFFPQAVRGVACLHSSNLIHCDVKPSNFVLCKGATLKLIDFGISKWIVNEDDVVLVDKDTQMGTLSYMAPESLKVSIVDFPVASSFVEMGTAADIWALGCILHEMLVGKLPFSLSSQISLKEKVSLITNADSQVEIPESPPSQTESSDGWSHWRSIALKCLNSFV